jgi:tRNA G18 (ribose-2'-O)-methylase SpoU
MLPRLEPVIASARHARVDRDDALFPVFTADDDALHAITGFAFHRGVLAAGQRRPPLALDALLDNLLRDHQSSPAKPRVLLVLENLSNHDNVGAIFRNAAALAGDRAAVILTPDCCDPLYRKSVRVSVGHVLRVPWTVLRASEAVGGSHATHPAPSHLLAALSRLRERGILTIALSPRADSTPIAVLRDHLRARSPRAIALLLGAEGPGLSDAAMRHADILCRIPMTPGVNSLNVATTAAVAMSWLA